MAKEDRTVIRERHGIANGRRVESAELSEERLQAITIVDGRQEVYVVVSSSDPTAFTPEQAELLAAQLIASANRVRENKRFRLEDKD